MTTGPLDVLIHNQYPPLSNESSLQMQQQFERLLATHQLELSFDKTVMQEFDKIKVTLTPYFGFSGSPHVLKALSIINTPLYITGSIDD